MAATQNYPYTTPSNYTYDTDLIELVGGIARLKDQTPTDAASGATYTSNIDLNNWSAGTKTGTATGGASVSGGRLDLTGGTTQYVDYDANLNADSQQVGCLRFRLTPNYSGSVASAENFISIGKSNALINRVTIFQFTTRLYARVYNSTGALLLEIKSTWNPASGTTYEIELNWDLTTGATRLYVDGSQLSTTSTATGTRSADIDNFRIGSNYNGTVSSNFYIEDVIYFNTVQHTASSYTPGDIIPETAYSTANPYIDTNATFKASELIEHDETSTASGSDAVKHAYSVAGQFKWNNGGTVENSNGLYAQSNTESEINAEIEDFVTTRSTVYLRSFLHSDDGSTTPTLDIVSIMYNSVLPDPTLPVSFELEGFVYNNDARAGLQVQYRPYLQGIQNGDIFHPYEWDDLGNVTTVGGFLEGPLYELPNGYFWELKIAVQRYKLTLPDGITEGATVELKNCTLTLISED
jgi:hypothetical protein